MFPLPIEGEPGQHTKWVLHAGMGSGHVAGGSGGEYFVGEFDGTAFHNDNPTDKILWADWGKDNYAAVSWDGKTGRNGERFWIGWMSNWQYANDVPTEPWRNALTVPRTAETAPLSRRIADGAGTCSSTQNFARSASRVLQNLASTCKLIGANEPLHPAIDQIGATRHGNYAVEFEMDTATEFGVVVRSKGEERTIIGYDTAKSQLFIDRTHSGKSNFHPEFAGRHSAPMQANKKRIKLHLFVDTSSVEVFGNMMAKP